MSVEGLRAWIGEVERKLAKRTRVFLVLTVIAIGIAAASLYLAIDYRNSAVSESDVRALQKEIETGIAKAAITPSQAPAPAPGSESTEAESPPTAKPEETTPQQKGDQQQNQSPPGGNGANSGASSGSAGAAAPEGASGGKNARVLELLEKTEQKNAK